MGKGIQFPLWLHIVCEIIFALFILRGLYAIWKYAVYQHIFARKKMCGSNPCFQSQGKIQINNSTFN